MAPQNQCGQRRSQSPEQPLREEELRQTHDRADATRQKPAPRLGYAGESRVAYRAGMRQGVIPTIPRSNGTIAKVNGSLADTPKRRLDIKRVTKIDAPTPMIGPAESSAAAGRKARSRMSRVCAPRAIRIPNSWTRWFTRNAITP